MLLCSCRDRAMVKASVAFRTHVLVFMHVRSTTPPHLLVALHIGGFSTPRDRIPLAVPTFGYSLVRKLNISWLGWDVLGLSFMH